MTRGTRRTHGSGLPQRGQALVEYTIIVPAFLLLLFGLLEFGLLFNHDLTIEYATREGARSASALANGGSDNCPAGAYNPDPDIIEAVQRVLTSPGSPVKNNLAGISQIQIYKATAAGTPVGASTTNTWTYTGPNTGPTTTSGLKVSFSLSGTQNWTVCQRNNQSVPPDSVGVSLKYTYTLVTPLSAVMKFFGPGGPAAYQLSDSTIMSLNPTN
jgi:Flp pilus assembly protein TadG